MEVSETNSELLLNYCMNFKKKKVMGKTLG